MDEKERQLYAHVASDSVLCAHYRGCCFVGRGGRLDVQEHIRNARIRRLVKSGRRVGDGRSAKLVGLRPTGPLRALRA